MAVKNQNWNYNLLHARLLKKRRTKRLIEVGNVLVILAMMIIAMISIFYFVSAFQMSQALPIDII